MAKDQKRQEPTAGTKYFKPSAPEYIKLRANQTLEGLYLGPAVSNFGICYKFRLDDGRIVRLGGNRVQLDSLFQEVETLPDFKGDLAGHYLEVRRGADVESKSARRVAQYEIGHVVPRCPKCKG
jgi:hypothetical protein